MQYDEFIDRVQERTGFDTREQAVEITEVVLETLGERLYLHRPERRHVASQLPKQLEAYLLKREGTMHYTMEEFYRRVAARADLSRQRAIDQAKAVISVLREALSAGEWDHLMEELPGEYHDLLA